MRDALSLAVGTLTAVPTPPPPRVDRGTARGAMLLAPVTAVPLAALAVLAHLVVAAGAMPTLVGAAAVLELTALWSRGLHLDGLADLVDGLSAGFERERALEVMRRGDVGPMSVAALLLVLLVQFAALATLLTTRRGMVLVVVAILASRYVLGWGCWQRVPAARHTGLGVSVGVPALVGARWSARRPRGGPRRRLGPRPGGATARRRHRGRPRSVRRGGADVRTARRVGPRLTRWRSPWRDAGNGRREWTSATGWLTVP